MISVTVEELEKNLDYYLKKSSVEDINILRDGKVISVLVSAEQRAFEEFMKLEGSLNGVIPDDMSYDELFAKRIEEKYLK